MPITAGMSRLLASTAIAFALTLPGAAIADNHAAKDGAKATKADKKMNKRASRHAQRFMRLYDINKDGKVTPEEIALDQARMFTAMDVNDDKALSVDEMRRRGRSLQVFRAATIFDMLDINGDGKLSVSEVQGPSKRWLKRYDTNGDGVMEADEVPHRHHGGRGGRR